MDTSNRTYALSLSPETCVEFEPSEDIDKVLAVAKMALLDGLDVRVYSGAEGEHEDNYVQQPLDGPAPVRDAFYFSQVLVNLDH